MSAKRINAAQAALILAHAEESSTTVEELVATMAKGIKTDKPCTLSVRFSTFEALVKAAQLIAPSGFAVFKADCLDPEFKGRAPTNSFVLREIDGPHGKPDAWRVA